jgi:hypothetical protein
LSTCKDLNLKPHRRQHYDQNVGSFVGRKTEAAIAVVYTLQCTVLAVTVSLNGTRLWQVLLGRRIDENEVLGADTYNQMFGQLLISEWRTTAPVAALATVLLVPRVSRAAAALHATAAIAFGIGLGFPLFPGLGGVVDEPGGIDGRTPDLFAIGGWAIGCGLAAIAVAFAIDARGSGRKPWAAATFLAACITLARLLEFLVPGWFFSSAGAPVWVIFTGHATIAFICIHTLVLNRSSTRRRTVGLVVAVATGLLYLGLQLSRWF